MNSQVKLAHLKSTGLMVLAAVFWSFGGLFIKLVNWNSIAIAGGRSVVAAFLILIVMRRPPQKLNKNKICGGLIYAGMLIAYVVANKLTTAANTIVLQYTAPIYVALFGHIFLKERAKKEDWISMLFVVLGMVLFFISDLKGGNLLGNIIAILSGVGFAFVAIFMRKQKDDSPLESIFWGNIITAVVALPFMIGPMPDSKSLLAILFLGVVQLGLGYVFYSIAIKNLTALEAVLIPIVEPILNPIWVFIFIGERPGKYALIGGAIVILSITLRSIYSLLKKEPVENEESYRKGLSNNSEVI